MTQGKMTSSGSAFPEVFGDALAAWNQRGRLADLVGPLLDWLLGLVGAERVMLFTISPGGGPRLRASRDTDGETVHDAERWISPYLVRRMQQTDDVCFFADSSRDRRLRTEPELELGVRIQSILAIPLAFETDRGFIYCDSRFRELEWPPADDRPVRIGCDLIEAGIRQDALDRARRMAERRANKLAATTAEPATRPAPPALRTGLREIDFHGFRTCCPELLQSIEEIERLATSMIPVLIEGESGTGKEILARAIHTASGRPGPFVSLHCAAIPQALVEIELFGHAKGAFTGAEKDRAGLFELARGGTIFLDDVSEMSPEMQVALLRVLETGRYRPVSAEEEQTTDCRVVSASLVPMGEGGSVTDIRSDLYYRLAGANITVPPLRDRREDILPLVRLFMKRYANDVTSPALPADVEPALLAYDWPGNVRELENLVRRVMALGDDELVLSRFEEITGAHAPVGHGASGSGIDMQSVVDRAEREAIIRALLESSGNKSRASKMLGLSRKTLYRRMEKHGIPL